LSSLQVKELYDLCGVIGKIKSQLIEDLPHSSHEGLLFQNDEITTGQLNNKTEIKIHLLAGQLLYFHNEEGNFIDLEKDNISEKLQEIAKKYNLKLPETKLEKVPRDQLSSFHNFAIKAKRSLELFRMKLSGKFSLIHLWPHNFDFSVEWFIGARDEQIGIGITYGDKQHEHAYLYVNPHPFNEDVRKQKLPVGIWHTSGWNGIKVEWQDLTKYPEQKIAEIIYQLFLVAKKNFE